MCSETNIDLTILALKLLISLRTMVETKETTTFSISVPIEQEMTLDEIDKKILTHCDAPERKDTITPGSIWYRYCDSRYGHTWFFCTTEPNQWCYESEVRAEPNAGKMSFLFRGKRQTVLDPPTSQKSAEQPADAIAVEERPANPSSGNEVPNTSSAEQPADSESADEGKNGGLASVLQYLSRDAWFVDPLFDNCRLTELNRQCNQAMEGWPTRLQCLDYRNWPVNQMPNDAHLIRQLQWVAHSCPHLKHLILPSLAQTMVKLTDITEAIQDVAGGCPKLMALSMRGYNVSVVAIEAMAGACPELKRLCLAAVMLTDPGLCAIAKGCRKLKELDVSHNPISNASIQKVAECCPLLETLSMKFCNFVNDDGIVPIALACPPLTRLNISCLFNLTDAAIDAVAQKCTRLQYLDASGCYRLTNNAIWSLARTCSKLESLFTEECDLMTWAPYNDLLKGCPRLTRWSW